MSWVPEFIIELAERMTATEAVILLGLVAVMVAGLLVPHMLERRRRAYQDRDDEYRRLQNL